MDRRLLQGALGETVKNKTDNLKLPRAQPAKYPIPDPIPDTPENGMCSLLGTPPRRENDWDYIKSTGRKLK